MFRLRSPETREDYDRYFDLRWRVLRKPWHQARGSERDPFDESGFHVMAEDDSGRLLGAGCLHCHQSIESQIRYMAVEEFARRRGVGRAMVEWLEAQAIQQCAEVMVLNSRESAVEFYQRLGYAVVANGDTLFGEIKHFKMRKDLEPIPNPRSQS